MSALHNGVADQGRPCVQKWSERRYAGVRPREPSKLVASCHMALFSRSVALRSTGSQVGAGFKTRLSHFLAVRAWSFT